MEIQAKIFFQCACILISTPCQKCAARFEASLVFSVPSLQKGNLKAVENLKLERKINIF